MFSFFLVKNSFDAFYISKTKAWFSKENSRGGRATKRRALRMSGLLKRRPLLLKACHRKKTKQNGAFWGFWVRGSQMKNSATKQDVVQ